ncbi:MAG: hypothetical protein KDD70_00715 [Bdellovibrionales bacterium]|nr:hypothetical protein [Bdellovibrionales bacterium]
MEKHIERSLYQIQTTIGDLVEALTQVAAEDGSSESESYELAARTLGSILSRQEGFDPQILD